MDIDIALDRAGNNCTAAAHITDDHTVLADLYAAFAADITGDLRTVRIQFAGIDISFDHTGCFKFAGDLYITDYGTGNVHMASGHNITGYLHTVRDHGGFLRDQQQTVIDQRIHALCYFGIFLRLVDLFRLLLS